MNVARGLDVMALSVLRLGDRVMVEDVEAGTVVFNSISGAFSPEFPEAAWGEEQGVMFKMDGGALVFFPLEDHDEYIDLKKL